MVKFSAFADEVSADFEEQVQFLVDNKVSFIEIRFVNKKNIVDLDEAELASVKQLLDKNGISVSAIGSPIGKIKLDEPFAPHLDKFKKAIDIAIFLKAPFIRLFSYYAPDGKNIDNYREEVMNRMAEKAALLKDAGIIAVHENEAHIYGHSAANCADVVNTVNSPNLKLAYDPANFVWGEKITNNVEVCWPLMKDQVVHVHIKDWKINSKDIGAIPGKGDAQIKELLEQLAAMQYEGFLTLEPHLKTGGQFGGETGPQLFAEAINATRNICEKVGLKYL